jgi:hypothetical protein
MTVYALLVGIDNYRSPVPPLAGCGNDIAAVEQFLRASSRDSLPAIETLRDDEATRAGVIDAFRDHLGQAGPGDTALFWYCGHGSTVPAPPQWWHLEPSRCLQTLVCVDSRHDGIPDLVDKEIAVLINEVAARRPHVAVVLDCCHAAGADRNAPAMQSRMVPAAETVVDMGRLLPQLRAQVRDGGLPLLTGGPAHVALAACQSHQRAYEVNLRGQTRGVFSLGLLVALRRPGSVPTYRELTSSTRHYVENLVDQQLPALYPIGESLVDQPFLGGQVRPADITMTMRYRRGAWEVDAGECHGLPHEPDSGDTRVAVYQRTPVREARVLRVLAERSIIEPIGWHPDELTRYPVVLSRLPVPATPIEIRTSDQKAAGRLRDAVATAGPGGQPSPHLRVLDRAQAPEFAGLVVTTTLAGAMRVLSADGQPLSEDISGSGDLGARRTVAQLEHIAQWQRLKNLTNPTSRLAGAVAIDVVPVKPGERIAPLRRPGVGIGASGAIELAYTPAGRDWTPPAAFIRLRNNTGRRLHCTLLDLTDRFRCWPGLLPGGEFIAPHHAAAAAEGVPVDFRLPPGRPVRPGESVRDWLMVIVAEEPVNSELFELGRLGEPARAATRSPLGLVGIVESLGLAAMHRDAGPRPATAGDWWTTLVQVVTRVPETGD